ncbi:MAG: hypothetical protein IKO55_02280 [Kiritimatiellae bacterium]|nr:hypothetical protein [Kiritimatiellia bacterium]
MRPALSACLALGAAVLCPEAGEPDGSSALRPIALAGEPVKTLSGEKGLMILNGKPLVIDDLWKNGTAAKAYWLWTGWQNHK